MHFTRVFWWREDKMSAMGKIFTVRRKKKDISIAICKWFSKKKKKHWMMIPSSFLQLKFKLKNLNIHCFYYQAQDLYLLAYKSVIDFQILKMWSVIRQNFHLCASKNNDGNNLEAIYRCYPEYPGAISAEWCLDQLHVKIWCAHSTQ